MDQEQKRVSRDAYKKEKRAEQQIKKRFVRIRLIPIWLRIILVTLLIGLCAITGTFVGYTIFGNGDAKDVFKKDTWTHIIDLVNKNS
ncbi:DNA-directed RNA polymerase subunit beta [Peribacillus alkalitolerans]|uniref:DNA-directed RNA polymerase subunit beta n=1 Tax=Peribacillus alkalitolerans TaxID=1550385 RepID=UPI0013D824F1|nr:DNA-directed RNA polymerase subunit beta [Peribacillus alkalitolerans]